MPAHPVPDIPEACYQPRDHRGRVLVCEERRGRRMIFYKPAARLASKIKVDRCVVTDREACDYLVRDWRNRCHFVELKGGGVEKAFKQLMETIPVFLHRRTRERFWCFVVCSGSPPNSLPGRQSAEARLRRAWPSMSLTVQTGQCEHHLTE